MSRTPSTMLDLGTSAPSFSLLDTEGKLTRIEDFQNAPALLVMFICNHCPYVKHVRTQLASLTEEYMKKRVAVVGINSNYVANYPEDSPELMKKEKQEAGYSFPYLYDESQEVARNYEAACTPDFYVFDASQKLVYRGQMDDSRPGNDVPVTGKDLKAALDAVLAGQETSSDQKPSLGCNIKWKTGNEPHYFNK